MHLFYAGLFDAQYPQYLRISDYMNNIHHIHCIYTLDCNLSIFGLRFRNHCGAFVNQSVERNRMQRRGQRIHRRETLWNTGHLSCFKDQRRRRFCCSYAGAIRWGIKLLFQHRGVDSVMQPLA
ncbi:hypothetical protein KQX54_012266 [Cotesia glomerata]|uniref:Uncharacterized protein n=1 Tax=Cotesia glomerata TaxID=32391 RepID=A0AAV7ID08_COTGL|nr:hypothetical protein KQX54_012266 [Cotesia glomerata]